MLTVFGCSTPRLSNRELASVHSDVLPQKTIVRVRSDGAWCWFGDPRAIETDKAVYVSSISSTGKIQVEQINRDGTRKRKVFTEKVSVDDHNNPSLMVLKDGNLLITFSEHNGPVLYSSKTTIPGDIESFGLVNRFRVKDTYGKGFTYPNLISRKEGNQDQIYLFWRGADWSPKMSRSIDNAETWDNAVSLIWTASDNQRPYSKYFVDPLGRIHMSFTNNHPSTNERNAIYYMVFDGNTFRKADGTVIGELKDLPFRLEDLDKVYHPSQFDIKLPYKRAWIWSLGVDSQNQPVAAFSVTDKHFQNEYIYANWDGKNWSRTTITDGGTTIQKNSGGESQEPYYSGGVFISPRDSTQIFLSAERSVSHHTIEEWKFDPVTKSARIVRDVTDGTNMSFRPIVPLPATGMTLNPIFDVLWLKGKYDYYTSYQTSIDGLLNDSSFELLSESTLSSKSIIPNEDDATENKLLGSGISFKSPRPNSPAFTRPTPIPTPVFDQSRVFNFRDKEFRNLRQGKRGVVTDYQLTEYYMSIYFSFMTDNWEKITGENAAEMRLRAQKNNVSIAVFKNNRVTVVPGGTALFIDDVELYIPKCKDALCKEFDKTYDRLIMMKFDDNLNLVRDGF